MARTSFNTWTVPDIPQDAIIVGAAAPNLDQADPTEDGWMISDMYAFNYLLAKASSNQTWLAVNTEEQLLDKYGDFLHGSPFQARKVVLSRRLLDAREITRAQTVSPERMIETVVDAVKKACEEAKKKKAPVIIFFFSHGKPSYDILLNAQDRRRGLTITQLQQAIDPEVLVTVATNSCYSGGWTVTPDLNATVYAAASAERRSFAWPTSGSVGQRVGGSVFASTMIKSLCEAEEPLVVDPEDPSNELRNLRLDETAGAQSDSAVRRTETLNAFVHIMDRVLKTEMSSSCRHEFHFSAQNDEWEKSWIKRTGVPLARFGERWDQLEDYYGPQYQAKLKGANSYTDEDPENPDYSDAVWRDLADRGWKEESLSSSQVTEGTTEGEAGQSTTSARRRSLVYVFNLPPGGIRTLQLQAQEQLDNLHGDWEGGDQTGLRGRLMKFIKNPQAAKTYEIFQTLMFRDGSMQYADFILVTFDIPPAQNGTRCLDWNWDAWFNIATRMGEPRRKFGLIETELRRRGCEFHPTEDQGPRFDRPLLYMAASLTNAGLTKSETFKKIDQIVDYIRTDVRLARDDLWRHEAVKEAGKKWLTMSGGWDKLKKTVQSLSPSKKAASRR